MWWLLGPLMLGCSSEREGDDVGECIDGMDNDGDDAVDCEDSDCANAPDCETAAVEIGPEGGTVSITGATLVIPPGALTEPTTIGIEVAGTWSASGLAYTPVFEFTPNGLVFAEAATLTLDIGGATIADVPAILWSPEATENWSILDTELLDDEASVPALRASITHFTSYVGGEVGDGGSDLAPWSTCMGYIPVPEGWLIPGCTLTGTLGNDSEIRWAITEWGPPGDPQPNTEVKLLNRTTDHIKITRVDVRNQEHVNDIHLGERLEPFLGVNGVVDPVYGWLPETNHGSAAWEASRQAVAANPDAAEWMPEDWRYFPTAVDVWPDQTRERMAYELCVEWVRMNDTGIVAEGEDCLSYDGNSERCPTGQVPAPYDEEQCIDPSTLTEFCLDVLDNDLDGLADCDDPDCADEDHCDPCRDPANWTYLATGGDTFVPTTYDLYEQVQTGSGSTACDCQDNPGNWICTGVPYGNGTIANVLDGWVETTAETPPSTWLVFELTRTGSIDLLEANYPGCAPPATPTTWTPTSPQRKCYELRVQGANELSFAPLNSTQLPLVPGPCQGANIMGGGNAQSSSTDAHFTATFEYTIPGTPGAPGSSSAWPTTVFEHLDPTPLDLQYELTCTPSP